MATTALSQDTFEQTVTGHTHRPSRPDTPGAGETNTGRSFAGIRSASR
jgi:hypothetical protein